VSKVEAGTEEKHSAESLGNGGWRRGRETRVRRERAKAIMSRPLSVVAPDWWDYTTLDRELIEEAARLTAEDILGLARPGFEVVFYDTLASFYLAEALEYIEAWTEATEDKPAGICGPIGPTEQLPLAAQLVNALEIDLRHAHFWGMDEWYADGKEVPRDHPLSFERAGGERFAAPRPGTLDHLITCLEEGKEPVAPIEEARKSFAVALAAYESARAGRAVRL